VYPLVGVVPSLNNPKEAVYPRRRSPQISIPSAIGEIICIEQRAQRFCAIELGCARRLQNSDWAKHPLVHDGRFP
jgi:hypothetical protein